MRSIMAAVAMVLAMGSSALLAQTTGDIRGTITNADGDPIRGITVRILGTDPVRGAISREDGNFDIRDLPPKIYDLQFTRGGYHTHFAENIRVIKSQTTDIGRIIMYRMEVYYNEPSTVYHPSGLVRPGRYGTWKSIRFYPSPRNIYFDSYHR